MSYSVLNLSCVLTSGVDGQQHEVERVGVQQCQRHPGPSQQPLEARYTDVQQVGSTARDHLRLVSSLETC